MTPKRARDNGGPPTEPKQSPPGLPCTALPPPVTAASDEESDSSDDDGGGNSGDSGGGGGEVRRRLRASEVYSLRDDSVKYMHALLSALDCAIAARKLHYTPRTPPANGARLESWSTRVLTRDGVKWVRQKFDKIDYARLPTPERPDAVTLYSLCELGRGANGVCELVANRRGHVGVLKVLFNCEPSSDAAESECEQWQRIYQRTHGKHVMAMTVANHCAFIMPYVRVVRSCARRSSCLRFAHSRATVARLQVLRRRASRRSPQLSRQSRGRAPVKLPSLRLGVRHARHLVAARWFVPTAR